jgi:hypothetical protein
MTETTRASAEVRRVAAELYLKYTWISYKGGEATVSEVAQALLAEDQAQLDYYREIRKRMPGAVLRRRGVIGYQ